MKPTKRQKKILYEIKKIRDIAFEYNVKDNVIRSVSLDSHSEG